MKQVKTGWGVVFAGCLLVHSVFATPVSVLLEEGIYTEETVGNREKAIEIYQRITDDDEANRKHVAEALFRLGRCYAAEGMQAEALDELRRLTTQFSENERLVKLATELITELSPPPLFPELKGTHLVYRLPVHLREEVPAAGVRTYTFYTTDEVVLSADIESGQEDSIDRFDVSVSTWEGEDVLTMNLRMAPSVLSLWDLVPGDPGKYLVSFKGSAGERAMGKGECRIEIRQAMSSQIGVDEIQADGDIRFISAEHKPNIRSRLDQRSFINSDFVHIEEMFDASGTKVKFTETHEGNHFRYRAALNRPVLRGESFFLGAKGWKENLVSMVADNELRYRMHHTPGGNVPVRRVEIYRLPQGAELLSSMPSDLPNRKLEDGRVEILIDTVIPAGGSLLTEFRYRLSDDADTYVAQITALKRSVDTAKKRRALEIIGEITAKATFHNGALVRLAQLVPTAEYNHDVITHAAKLASQFGYHTGALVTVAEIAADADHGCQVLRKILDQIVLNMGGTPAIVQLARDTVAAKGDDEKLAEIQSRLERISASADYLKLTEAMEGQKARQESQGPTHRPLDLQPAPWADGDVLRYRLLTKVGMEAGNLIWAIRGTEQDGKACWKIEQRLVVPSSGTIMASEVVAEKERFRPLFGRTKHSLGTVDAEYLPGKVLLTPEGADTPRRVDVPEPIYDNEQVVFLMRRLPLAKGYHASFPIMSVLSGASSLECRIRVMGREAVAVSAESYSCWKVRIQVYAGPMKAVEQTAWFTVEGHVPVKFVTDQLDMELVEHNEGGEAQNAMDLTEHGVRMELPEGWFGYKLPAAGKDSEIVRLMPPDMKLVCMLCKALRAPVTMGVKEIATRDVDALKSYFKDYAVRNDSLTEKKINGRPACIFTADYEDQGKAKVEYRAYYVAGPSAFWFVFRVDAEQFDAEKATFDALIEGMDVSLSPEDDLQTCVGQLFGSNWRDVKEREDIEWGAVTEHENGNCSIRYRYSARIWDGDMQVFEQTFTFDSDGGFVDAEQTKGYPKPLNEEGGE